MPIQSLDTVLLLGAGFTHNFGGYLAKDMWAVIFNHDAIQRHPRLQEAMRAGDFAFDFEGVYDKVLTGDFSPEEKRSIVQAVEAAYGDLDEVIRSLDEASSPVSLPHLVDFIQRFAGPPGRLGLIFSLNQDLLLERCLSFNNILDLPGLRPGDRFSTRLKNSPVSSMKLRLPNGDEVDQLETQYIGQGAHLLFVKLHGSMEWTSADGSSHPVIGTQKEQLINREPLLKWYAHLFGEALTARPNRKLVVIGYGFRDDHINRTVGDACRTHGLKVIVVDPEEPEQFNHRLHGHGSWQQIRKGWAGYYRCTLVDLFPRGEAKGPGRIALKNLVRAVFGE
jgi:hypothetical protein